MSLKLIGALIHADPKAAREKLLAAFLQSGGDRKRAAELLGADVRSVYRWLERLDAWDDLDKLLEENGLEVFPGPPRSKDRLIAALVEARGNIKRAADHMGRDEKTFRTRLRELDIYDDANKVLRAAGFPMIERERAS